MRKRKPKVTEEYSLPDGSKVYVRRDVDRYYGLKLGTTNGRRHRGWSIEECENNRKLKNTEPFYMPDGNVLYNPKDVNDFYGLSSGTTRERLKSGWTHNECANNHKKSKCIFQLPNRKITCSYEEVDRYWRNKPGTTKRRLWYGWSSKECSVNQCIKKGPPVDMELDELEILDKKNGLCRGSSHRRWNLGWSLEELRDNLMQSEISFRFTIDGKIIRCPESVDKKLGLKEGTTRERILLGWNAIECVRNCKDEYYNEMN